MKILLTTDWYKPTINGVVTSVDNLCSGLTALGHEVRIAALSGLVHSMREGNVSYYGSVGMGIIYPEARLQIPWNKKMTEELEAWGPDIVHSQCKFSTFFLARKIAHDLTIPLVHTYHTIYADYTHYFFRNKALGEKAAVRFTEITLNQADRVIVPSEKIRTVLSGYQICTPIEVMASGLPLLCRRDPCLDGVIEHGKSGFLYEKDNEFTGIADLLKHNRKLREEIGKAARQKAVETCSSIWSETR